MNLIVLYLLITLVQVPWISLCYFLRSEQSLKITPQIMDQAVIQECCFCHKAFERIGNHYKYCPKRDGKDFQHLLSQKTLAKKEKGKKVACPKCGKLFLRLETHLRTSATCRNVSSLPEQIPTSTTLATTSHSEIFVPHHSPPPSTNNHTQLITPCIPSSTAFQSGSFVPYHPPPSSTNNHT